jgi:hypothetical protein
MLPYVPSDAAEFLKAIVRIAGGAPLVAHQDDR